MNFIFKCFQTVLIILNTFYFLNGIALCLLSFLLYMNTHYLNDLLKDYFHDEYYQLLYGLIIFGFILIAVGLLGFLGIVNENVCLVFLYFILLFIIFIIKFLICIVFYSSNTKILNTLLDKLKQTIKIHYGQSVLHTKAIDYLHSRLNCCGIQSPNDWFDSLYTDQNVLITYNNKNLAKIPQSCCLSMEYDCLAKRKFYEVGCETGLRVYYRRFEFYTIWILALATILQLTLLILTLYSLCILMVEKRYFSSKRRFNLSLTDESSVGTQSTVTTKRKSKENKFFSKAFYL